MLRGTPFGSYVIPGLILAGVVMMGWIVGEVLLFNQPSAWTWIEVFYLALGLVMVVLGLIVGRT